MAPVVITKFFAFQTRCNDEKANTRKKCYNCAGIEKTVQIIQFDFLYIKYLGSVQNVYKTYRYITRKLDSATRIE